MTKPMIRIHDVSTNIITDREMTDEEFAQHEIDKANYETTQVAQVEALAAEEAAKQQAFNDAVAAAVVAVLAAQTPATTAEPTVEE